MRNSIRLKGLAVLFMAVWTTTATIVGLVALVMALTHRSGHDHPAETVAYISLWMFMAAVAVYLIGALVQIFWDDFSSAMRDAWIRLTKGVNP